MQGFAIQITGHGSVEDQSAIRETRGRAASNWLRRRQTKRSVTKVVVRDATTDRGLILDRAMYIYRERQRETERETERDRERDRERQRERGREKERETERERMIGSKRKIW